MNAISIENDHQPELDIQLGDLLYRFNCEATGISDGTMLHARLHDETGALEAAISGYTWGGCCEIVHLWVAEHLRRTGIGTRLLRAAEDEAVRRGCHQIVLSTHDFQAPLFYEKHGFERIATIPDYPAGREKYLYIKHLVSR